jgi:hypothetical protein
LDTGIYVLKSDEKIPVFASAASFCETLKRKREARSALFLQIGSKLHEATKYYPLPYQQQHHRTGQFIIIIITATTISPPTIIIN